MQSSRKNLVVTLASGRSICPSDSPLSGSNAAIQQGSRQSYWEVCLKNPSPGGPLPLPPQPIGNPPCLVQRRPRPGHFSIQGKRMRSAAACCCLLLPPTLLRMFGKKAEMTGTTIRLPYLEKMALHSEVIPCREGRAVSRCRAGWKGCCTSAARLWISLNRQLGWTSPGPPARREHLEHVIGPTSVLCVSHDAWTKWLLNDLNGRVLSECWAFFSTLANTDHTFMVPGFSHVLCRCYWHSFVF